MFYPKTKEFQKSLTPDKVIEMLKEGNQRFITKTNSGREYHNEIIATAQNPAPWAIIHRCMDSRVLPEVIFDIGVGEVFVTGVAGNIINDDITGSMEFACEVTGVKLILILGHTKCIAVESAMNKVEMGKVTGILEKISPAVDASKNKNDLTSITELNIKNSIEHLRNSSRIISDLEIAGEIKIAGAMYNVESGIVTFID